MSATATHGSEPEQIVAEMRSLLRRSVSPNPAPTSRDLGARLPALARLLGARGLHEREARSILEVYVTKLLELGLQERLSAILHTTPSARGRRPTIRVLEGPGLALDA